MITSDTLITTKIDHMALTVKSLAYPPHFTTERRELSHGLHGYDIAVRYVDGRIELTSSIRADMPPHIIFGGSCIDRLCADHKISSYDLLKLMHTYRASRLDIAIDVRNGSLDIAKLTAMFDASNVVTRAQERIYITGTRNVGETLYIGSPRSNRRVRIYDKAAEQKLDNVLWTRIEYQLRGKHATIACDKLCSGELTGNDAGAIIKSFVDYPDDRDWIIATGNAIISISASEDKQGARRLWLFNTAIAALCAEALESGEGTNLIDGFALVAHQKYRELVSKYKKVDIG